MGNKSSHNHYSRDELLATLEQKEWHLFHAAVVENRRTVKRAIRVRNGDTGLHCLAHKGVHDGLQAVLQAVLDQYASEKGAPLSPEEYRQCAAKTCNVVNDRGRTSLMAAAKGGHLECVKILLDHHASLWIRDRQGGATVMHYAASAGHEEVVALLAQWSKTHPPAASLHAPANGLIDMPNANGLTPLHYAVWHKRYKVVAQLCELGASLYSTSVWGNPAETVPCVVGSTPLHVAAMSGSTRCTKGLMKAYAARLAEQEEAARAAGTVVSEPLADPRLVQDSQGNLPFAVALAQDHRRLLLYLHPFTSLAEMFSDERPEERVVGVPKLQELAALVAQKLLLEQLEKVEAQPLPLPLVSNSGVPAAAAGSGTAHAAASSSPGPASNGAGSEYSASQRSSAEHHATVAPVYQEPAGARREHIWAVPGHSAAGEGLQQSVVMAASATTGPEHQPPQGEVAPTQSQVQAAIQTGRSSGAVQEPTRWQRASASEPGDTQVLPAQQPLGGPSWVERRGAWRTHLPPQLTRAGDPAHGCARFTRACSDSLSPNVEPTQQAVGRGGTWGVDMSQDGSGRWLARRSVWRQTLARHGPQLLAAATQDAQLLLPLLLQRQRKATQEGVARMGVGEEEGQGEVSAEHHDVQPAAAQDAAALAQQGTQAPPAFPLTLPESSSAPSVQQVTHIPPDAAHSLRLLGLAGSVSNLLYQGEEGGTADSPSTSRVLGGPGEGEGTVPQQASRRTTGDGEVDRGPYSGLEVAVQLLRVHRLTNGLIDPDAMHMASGIPEEEEEQPLPAAAPPAQEEEDAAPHEAADTNQAAAPAPTQAAGPAAEYGHGESGDAGATGAVVPPSPFGSTTYQQLAAFTGNGAAGQEPGVAGGTGHQEAHVVVDGTVPSTDTEGHISPVAHSNSGLGRAHSITTAVLAHSRSKALEAGGQSAHEAAGMGLRSPTSGAGHEPHGPPMVSRNSVNVAAVMMGSPSPTGGVGFSRAMLHPKPGTLQATGSLLRSSQAQLLSRVVSMMRTSEAGEEMCGVCLESGKFVNLTGCTHRICVTCAKELVRLHDLKPALCPFCRHFILGFTLYIPHAQRRQHTKSVTGKA